MNELKFTITKEVYVDIDWVADRVGHCISEILTDNGYDDDEINVIDIEQVKKEIAKKWLSKARENGLQK